MKSGTHDYGREIFAKERAEARSEGELHSYREMLLVAVEGRGLTLSENQSHAIDECDDAEMMRRWSKRAVRGLPIDKVFE